MWGVREAQRILAIASVVALVIFLPFIKLQPAQSEFNCVRIDSPNGDFSLECTKVVTATPKPSPTATVEPTLSPSPTVTPTVKPSPTPLPTGTPVVSGEPYPDAPLCANHDNETFHTLWNSEEGCHYDHEHGEDPFTDAVAAAFPGFDLFALLGNREIGHTNPSSPTENVVKHGGMKWQVQPNTPQDCVTGFEGAEFGVGGAVIQYHVFGNSAVEFESRIHSTAALIRQCVPGSQDYGYIYTVQHQEYGQRTVPYQGTVLPYPDTFQPAYNGGFGPYFTSDCVGPVAQCRSSLDFIRSRNLNTNSIWTSKPTGFGERPQTSSLFRLLFRTRDTYQVFDWNDFEYPFTFLWVCSSDGGETYSQEPGCRYNNSTTRVHEVAGNIPTSWDNLEGFDQDTRVGRITASGFVGRFGTLNLSCIGPSESCFPIVLDGARVGSYGGELSAEKVSNPNLLSNPERDVYFCNSQVCEEDDPGATSSGWLGAGN